MLRPMSTNGNADPAVLPEPDMIRVGPLVAYQTGVEGYERSHGGLLVWHWCDHHLWAGRPGYDRDPDGYRMWTPGAVGAHTLVSLDPLHLEPSVYWPDCCGLHGWIRGGVWSDA